MQPDFLTGSILDTLDGTYRWMIFDKWLFSVIGEEILFKWFLNICIKNYSMWVIFETDDNIKKLEDKFSWKKIQRSIFLIDKSIVLKIEELIK